MGGWGDGHGRSWERMVRFLLPELRRGGVGFVYRGRRVVGDIRSAGRGGADRPQHGGGTVRGTFLRRVAHDDGRGAGTGTAPGRRTHRFGAVCDGNSPVAG